MSKVEIKPSNGKPQNFCIEAMPSNGKQKDLTSELNSLLIDISIHTNALSDSIKSLDENELLLSEKFRLNSSELPKHTFNSLNKLHDTSE